MLAGRTICTYLLQRHLFILYIKHFSIYVYPNRIQNKPPSQYMRASDIRDAKEKNYICLTRVFHTAMHNDIIVVRCGNAAQQYGGGIYGVSI